MRNTATPIRNGETAVMLAAVCNCCMRSPCKSWQMVPLRRRPSRDIGAFSVCLKMNKLCVFNGALEFESPSSPPVSW